MLTLPASIRSFLHRYSFPLSIVVGLRIGLSIWLAIIWLLFLRDVSQSEMAIWQTYHHMPAHNTTLANAALGVWLRWDAVHYMNIAYYGYPNLAHGEMNYWPLYPYLVRWLSSIIGVDVTLAGLLLSTAAAAGAMILLFELVRLKFQDERLARWTVLTWGVYPTSFFLFAPFTEALFASFAAGVLLMLHKKRWIIAGVLVLLGGLTRSQGILLTIPLGLEIARQCIQTRQWPDHRAIIAGLISPLGFLSYLLWQNQQTSMDIAQSYQKYSQAKFIDPFQAIILAIQRLISQPNWLQITELLSILAFTVLLVWMLTRTEFNKEYPLIFYGLAVVAFATVKHNLAASPMQSSNRYVLNALPAFISIAWLLLRLPDAWRKGLVMISLALLMILSCLYALWIFIG